jgi:nicotinate-nucleotide--dimethylbenzimidazole phosphoribosyltransferase
VKPWYLEQAAKPDEQFRERAQTHTDNLTKPNGALGILETIATTLAALQSSETPNIDRVAISVFAADHGVAEEGVSAFPQAVTAEMVRNFSNSGAAICVLAKQLDANFQVINVGTVTALEALPSVSDQRITAGTHNFVHRAAMDEEQVDCALAVGKKTIEGLDNADCFIGGEMGIANTTSAAALACALLELPPSSLAGRGTGVSDDGVHHKAIIIEQALQRHGQHLNSPMAILQYLGGLEIAALIGTYLRAAQLSIPVLVDGFICSVAALVAVSLNPSIRPWLLFSHQSDEAGHQRVLEAMQAQPLLKLGMRLGEGSGAAIAVPVIKMACALHNEMASFDSAAVSRH